VPGAGAERAVLIGIDLGTSAAKILACTPSGANVALESASYPLETPRPQWVEQDANDVYQAAMKTLHGVLADVRLRGDEVLAIGFSCAMHGLLAVDERGEPLGPLITWMDRRSASVADRWRADGTAAKLYANTGAPIHPMLPSCKLRWLSENDPGILERAARFVSLKELFVFRWTGEWLIDWGMASGTGLFDPQTRAWDDYALDEARVAPEKLSKLAAPSTTLRTLRPNVAAALGIDPATAVVLASNDGALANLGVGAVTKGELALTLGTSGAIRTVVDTAALDPNGRTFCYAYDDKKFVAGGPTSSAGAVLNALHALFLEDVPQAERFSTAVALAEKAEAGAKGLTVMPFLSGERAPYWLSELRGGLVGLDLSHTRSDVMRAAFESVVFALATVYDVLRERVGDIHTIRLSGGLTHAAFVRQLVADVFGCGAVLANQEEASAFGAAMLAGIAVAAIADDRAVAALLQPVHAHHPNPDAVTLYRAILARYRDVVAANLPLYS
jgi:gluconokinase